MLLEVSQQSLIQALQHVAPALSSKSVIPILSGILIRADSAGMKVSASSSSLMLLYELSAAKHEIIVHTGGSIVIPARYFIEIIKHCPSSMVTLETMEDKKISIRSSRSVYQLSGMNADEYPAMSGADPSNKIRFSNSVLAAMIKQIAFAVSASESRPVLTGVSCLFEGSRLKLLATDGIRLATQTTALDRSFTQDAFSIIIPGKHLLDYSKMLQDEQGNTELFIGSRSILLRTGNLYMQSSLIEGQYPALGKLNTKTITTDITLESSLFLQALERVCLLAERNHAVKLNSAGLSTIALFSRTPEVGDVQEEVPVKECNGEEITIYFNGKYMMEILRSINCRLVKIKFSGKWNPIHIEPDGRPDALYILTPIKTQD